MILANDEKIYGKYKRRGIAIMDIGILACMSKSVKLVGLFVCGHFFGMNYCKESNQSVLP